MVQASNCICNSSYVKAGNFRLAAPSDRQEQATPVTAKPETAQEDDGKNPALVNEPVNKKSKCTNAAHKKRKHARKPSKKRASKDDSDANSSSTGDSSEDSSDSSETWSKKKGKQVKSKKKKRRHKKSKKVIGDSESDSSDNETSDESTDSSSSDEDVKSRKSKKSKLDMVPALGSPVPSTSPPGTVILRIRGIGHPLKAQALVVGIYYRFVGSFYRGTV